MRSFGHWTPRYIKNRIAEICYQRGNPDQPWLTRSANAMLDTYLARSDVGLEFGSGRSTVWFAKRICHLTSVEHDERWADKVREMLKQAGITNADYRFVPRDKDEDEGAEAQYVKVIDDFNPDSLDFCLVDGAYRQFCALRVVEKIRPGGVLVIDNVNWFLPSNSYSPNSRSFADGPKGPVWKQVEQRTSRWRRIWTTTGVTDTAFFFKPCQQAAKQD